MLYMYINKAAQLTKYLTPQIYFPLALYSIGETVGETKERKKKVPKTGVMLSL